MQVERQGLACAFGIQVFIPGEFGVVPGIAKFTADKGQGFELFWFEFHERLVECECLARVETGKVRVRGGGIVYVTAGESDAGAELLPEIGGHIEARTHPAAYTLERPIRGAAEEGFSAKTYVAAEREGADAFDLSLKIPNPFIGTARVLVILVCGCVLKVGRDCCPRLRCFSSDRSRRGNSGGLNCLGRLIFLAAAQLRLQRLNLLLLGGECVFQRLDIGGGHWRRGRRSGWGSVGWSRVRR